MSAVQVRGGATASRGWTGDLSGPSCDVLRLWRAGGACRVRSVMSGSEGTAPEM